jgi:hypothetical protein
MDFALGVGFRAGHRPAGERTAGFFSPDGEGCSEFAVSTGKHSASVRFGPGPKRIVGDFLPGNNGCPQQLNENAY